MKKNFILLFIPIILLSCGGEEKPAIQSDINKTNSQQINNEPVRPQKMVCNYITKNNFDKWYEDQLGRCPYESYQLENVIFEGTITKSAGLLGTYEINYIYHPDPNWKECKHTLTFVLYDLYKMYTDDQLNGMVGKSYTIYAPKVEYKPFKTADLTNCGLWASIEVFSGWKFVNKDDYELVEPKRNPYFLKYE
jgi:hypothetical protein